jgi:dihydroorotate dehydrogenase electron transfer subunit
MTSSAFRGGEAGVAPVQVRGPVLNVRRVDAYHALAMVAPPVARRFIHDVRQDHGGTVEFVFAARGAGTRWLAARRGRDLLDVVGPLGRPFPVPRDHVSCLLVGVEHSSAVLFPMADRLRSRGCQVDFLLGGSGVNTVFGALRARRTGRSATITTADGSLGARGGVTDMLSQVIHEARTDVIYAAGPTPVLREVSAVAGRYEIPVRVCVEEPMACGTGACMTCVLPVVGSDGITRVVRCCVDGPVFRGDLVRWDDIGTIPFDALGAPGWKPPRPPRQARVWQETGPQPRASGGAGHGG